MADLQPERTGVTRVKELEEIVKKLEQENKQLLNKVRTTSPTLYHKKLANDLQEIQDDPHTSKSLNEVEITSNGQKWDNDDELESSIVNLEYDEGLDDEWLFVSPKLPPTPAQKNITPVRWLLDGGTQGDQNNELPSIDDVRKTLTYNINEAENLTSYMGSSGAYSPGSTSPTLRSRSPTNKTAQKYLNQVRQRRLSPPSYQHKAHQRDLSPSASPLTRTRHGMDHRANGAAVPVIKWKARQPPPVSSDDDTEEEVPRVNWKVKQVPSAPPATNDDVPKVRWNPSMAIGSDDENEAGESEGKGTGDEAQSVPVVKWKARVPPSNGESLPKNRLLARPVARKTPPVNDQGVPVVKWKAKLPANEAGDEDVPIIRHPSKNTPPTSNQDVPVVKWKAKLPPDETNEDVPIVKWKAKLPPDETNEDVPVVKWKAKLPPDESNEDVPIVTHPSKNTPSANNAGIPVVKWKAKLPANEEDVPVIRRSPASSNTSGQQRRGLISPKTGGLTPPTMNGDSDQSSGSEREQHSAESLRVSRYTAHQSGIQRPRSGSARSPSGLQYNSGLSRPARITSPGHSQVGSGNSSSQEDIQSNTSVSSFSSTGTRLKIPRKQAQDDEHSSPHGQVESKRLSSGLHQSSSRAGNVKQQRVTPPSQGSHKLGGGRTSLGSSRSAPSQVQSPRSGGTQRHLTPPSGSTNPRRMLPTPPSAGKSGQRQGQRLKPTRSTSPRRSQPQSEAQVQDGGDSWLEGCF